MKKTNQGEGVENDKSVAASHDQSGLVWVTNRISGSDTV